MTKEIREDVAILGQSISDEVFEYLLKHFKEAFSHTSLSIEDAFDDSNKRAKEIYSHLDDGVPLLS